MSQSKNHGGVLKKWLIYGSLLFSLPDNMVYITFSISHFEKNKKVLLWYIYIYITFFFEDVYKVQCYLVK